MPYPAKLTKALAETMSQHARQGLPIGRAAAISGIHRVTAMRWLREGASEIDQAEDDADLSPRAQFAITFERARAEYVLGLNVAWRKAVKGKDANLAKSVAAMLASVSPDEYSERRVVRTIDLKVSGNLAVSRYSTMSAEDLDAERSRIEQRRKATAGDDDWRGTAARLPGQCSDDAGPERKNPTVEIVDSGSINRKSQITPLPADDGGSSGNISPSRTRASLPAGIDGTIDPDCFELD